MYAVHDGVLRRHNPANPRLCTWGLNAMSSKGDGFTAQHLVDGYGMMFACSL